jgi:hypothetical protein
VVVRVSGFYRINTEESDPVVYDEAYVELVQGTDSFVLAHFANEDEVGLWTSFEGNIDADVFDDTPITFQLRSVVDGSAITNFFFDTLTLTAERRDCMP